MLIFSRRFRTGRAPDRRYPTIPDKVRVLSDKEGERGTWQRISRRRMDQSRNFASNGVSLFFPYRYFSTLESLLRLFQSSLCRDEGIFLLSSSSATPGVFRCKSIRFREGFSILLLKDYAVTHVLNAFRGEKMRYITVFQAS